MEVVPMSSLSLRHLPLVLVLLTAAAYLTGCCCCPPLPTDFIGLNAPGRSVLPDVRDVTDPLPRAATNLGQRY